MNLHDSLNRYYYDTIVCDLRQMARCGGGELSYNSAMYLDVISYQAASGGCTISMKKFSSSPFPSVSPQFTWFPVSL